MLVPHSKKKWDVPRNLFYMKSRWILQWMVVKSSHLIKWWEIWWHQIHSSALRWLVTCAFPLCSSNTCLYISLPYFFLSGPLEASHRRVSMLGECDCKPSQTSGEQWSKVLSSVRIVGIVSSWRTFQYSLAKTVSPRAPGRAGELLGIRPWAFLKEEKPAVAVGFDFMQWFLFLLNDSHGWQRLERLLFAYLVSL